MAETPFIEAVKNGDAAKVRDWLDAGVDVNQKSASGDTALAWAAWEGQLDVVRLLLERSADRTLARNAESSPAALAEKKGRPDILKLLTGGPAALVSPQPPPVSQPARATEAWKPMGAATVAHEGLYPDINRKLTTIFNFESRERLIVTENTLTRAENVTPPTSFDDLPQSVVKNALAAFTRLGGAADQDFVLHGQDGIVKTRREPLLK